MTSSGEEDRATTEAAHWLVALDDDPDDLALRKRFQGWLDSSPANIEAWKNTADIDDLTRFLPAQYEAHWKPYQAERNAASRAASSFRPGLSIWRLRWSRPRQVFIGSLVAAIATCFAIFITPTLVLRIDADEVTATGEQRSVRLEDGSMVRMGPGSALASAFANGKRGVRLLKGEAFFEVVPDPNRPFAVAAGVIETTVLGTSFDVRLEENAVAVAVRNGHVQVDLASAKPPVSERLEAGQWTRITWTGDVAGGRVRSEDVAAWKDGQIVALDRALVDVVGDLRRYYDGVIILTNEGLGQQRVTGVYNVADPVEALRAMAGAYGGSVHQVSPWILVVSGS